MHFAYMHGLKKHKRKSIKPTGFQTRGKKRAEEFEYGDDKYLMLSGGSS